MACGRILNLAGALALSASALVTLAPTAVAAEADVELASSSSSSMKRLSEAVAEMRGEMAALRKTNAALSERVDRLRVENAEQAKQLADMQAGVGAGTLDRVLALERRNATWDTVMSLDTDRDLLTVVGADMLIAAGNLYVRNGMNASTSSEPPNGLGNIIIGYDEDSGVDAPDVKTGSHNLIIGPFHSYTSYGGIVAGSDNAVTGLSASVIGGIGNVAQGDGSAVCGGSQGLAQGPTSSVSGGFMNLASGESSSVSGGVSNLASGDQSSVSGGSGNQAGGTASAVSGGEQRSAPGQFNWAAGPALANR